ncbi:unnamed protein product [Gongylonema pulchrum]|uniref:DNA-directed RNA polymerase n=1 Tax=Gongylonema pulchrum TaxID=637853 RepID=A0A183DRS0_9BILA|nr:unnamed protein product [Gongylonema pulchrum]
MWVSHVQLKLFIPANYQQNSTTLWTEFFGTVHDSLGRIAELNRDSILGRCLLVRIVKLKDDYGTGSKWAVNKVVRILEKENSLPSQRSPSFTADAIRYMMEEPRISDAIKNTETDFARLLKDPHHHPDTVLKRRV